MITFKILNRCNFAIKNDLKFHVINVIENKAFFEKMCENAKVCLKKIIVRIFIFVDWLIYSYVVVTSNMSTSCECVYFFYIYRKTLRKLKTYIFILSSIALRSSFDALSMLWIWCFTFFVALMYHIFILLTIADLIKMFINQCKLWQKFQFYYSSCELFELCRRVNKIQIIHQIFFVFYLISVMLWAWNNYVLHCLSLMFTETCRRVDF